MINPLLNSFTLPPFSAIQPEHVVPAIKEAIKNCRMTVENTIKHGPPYTWENLIQPLAEADNYLNRIFSLISHLNAVKDNKKNRKVYERSFFLLTEYTTWIGQHKGLYQAYCSLKDSDSYEEFDYRQKKLIDNNILNFTLSGIELNKEKQKRYAEIKIRLSELSSTYSNNVLDATTGWSKFITNKVELLGIPKNVLSAAKKNNGWLLTLDSPSYLPIIMYSENKELREEIYEAYSTRASDQGPNAGKWDNSLIMDEILALRYELANLLGFKSYADKSLATKMAGSTSEVIDFLLDLAKRARPQAYKELSKLNCFAKNKFNVDQIKPSDLIYYSEKQKKDLYSISDEQLRPYFPEERVINGLFEIIKRIYGISVKENVNIDVYHPDVRFFNLFDEKDELRGSFYLDLYVRKRKRGGAWMSECVNRMRKTDGNLQKPVAYLTCNFNRPIKHIKQSLFTHKEVITLFHEFGHALHHILSLIEIPDISGINGVPWDVVEFPSQFMENWCWEPEALSFISGHYKTGESLPQFILDKLISLKRYQSALCILHQLEFSLFDFYLHTKFNAKKGLNILSTLYEVRKQVSIISYPKWNRFSHTFNHIFSGNYAAGYYSYLWANVLAADAYSRFKEEGIFNRQVGQSFLENILICGGSKEPIEMFKNFRGRKPKIDAILRQYGIQRQV